MVDPTPTPTPVYRSIEIGNWYSSDYFKSESYWLGYNNLSEALDSAIFKIFISTCTDSSVVINEVVEKISMKEFLHRSDSKYVYKLPPHTRYTLIVEGDPKLVKAEYSKLYIWYAWLFGIDLPEYTTLKQIVIDKSFIKSTAIKDSEVLHVIFTFKRRS